MNEILRFIERFKGSEDVFLHGCCYWFARILWERFHSQVYSATIVYESVEGHFLTEIRTDFYAKPRFFDIRGDVTDLYAGKSSSMNSVGYLEIMAPEYYSHLMMDCRDFVERK